jgi:hypothetical protein
MKPENLKWSSILWAFKLIFLVCLLGTGKQAMSQDLLASKISNLPKFTVKQNNGRQFSGLSISNNGSEWLITECKFEPDPDAGCFILKYNLTQDKLYRFALPKGFQYQAPRFSSSGNWIVATRNPVHSGKPEDIQKSWEQSEIVMFRPDGSEFKVLPIKGFNTSPVMSPGDKKIAFWTPKILNVGSKTRTKSLDYDVYEFDLKTQKVNLFSGIFNFVEVGPLQYLGEDQVIFFSYDTMDKLAGPIDPAGDKIYILDRDNNKKYRRVNYENTSHTRNPSIDTNGTIYFQGVDKKEGSSFFQGNLNTITKSWVLPFIDIRNTVVSPTGRYIGFTHQAAKTGSRYSSIEFGLLDINTNAWKNIAIPPLNTAELMPVTLK